MSAPMEKLRFLTVAAVVTLVPCPALANAGLPMISIVFPYMLIWLLPIIALEAWVMRTGLSVTIRAAAITSLAANLLSTLIGVPITWGILVILELITGGGTSGNYDIDTLLGKLLAVTWEAPWLMPYEQHLNWMIPAAMLVLAVPFFFVSWRIESAIVWARHRKALDKALVRRVCLKANLLSYFLMYVAFLGLDWILVHVTL